MGTITTLDYATMAEAVYHTGGTGYVVNGYETKLFEEGMSWGGLVRDGFKGCTYADPKRKEVVVAFKGTVPSDVQDLLADLKIAIGLLPNQCSSAHRLFQRASAAYPDYQLSITGHSLGGGLSQVVGHWTGCPFVTFNAPGMWGDIQRSKLNLLAPEKMWRSIKGTFTGSLVAKQKATTGRNFRNVLDPVSAYGMHYGPVTRFWSNAVHSMSDILKLVQASKWAAVNPFDPANKEWGELSGGTATPAYRKISSKNARIRAHERSSASLW